VYFASSTGGMLESETYYATGRRAGFDRAARRLLAAQPVSRPGEAVARDLAATGPVESVSSACASATLAIGLALEAVRDGEVEIAIAGGADSLCRVTYAGFNALQAVDPEPCRPFRVDRRGLSLGEGAAVLVIERADRAAARGAHPLATLRGAGASADAHHMTAPDPTGAGAARALERALLEAGCRPDEVDLLNAHGTGTPLNDVAEYQALLKVFGAGARSIPVLATKASVGHLLGSAGAIEAVATILALGDQCLQPVPGGGDPDPAAPVRVARAGDPCACRVAVSLNMGFGGCNGALVLERAAPRAGMPGAPRAAGGAAAVRPR
jgi:3-oxoacyl-[acyl-carrier-protein] synthase II